MATVHSPKSRFISILSMITMMAAWYSLLETFSTLSMQRSQEFQLVKQFMPAAFISPATLSVQILLSVAAIVASSGLFFRWNWGRILFIAVLVLTTGWEIYSSINSYLLMNALLAGNALLTGYGFGSSLTLIVLWSVFGIGLTLFLIWKLRSPAIQSEFRRSGGKTI